MYKPATISLFRLLSILSKDAIIEECYGLSSINKPSENEVFIWIGSDGVKDVDLKILKSRNVYSIFYNTEPVIFDFGFNETWTYSRFILNKYRLSKQNIVNFVPIICEENVPTVSYNTESELKLVFLGREDLRKSSIDFLKQNELIKKHYVNYFNIWNDCDYNKLMTGNANIYLNIKRTDVMEALPAFRINKLLSHKCIVISDHTNDIDEELYKDIIYFCNLDEIESVFKQLLEKSPFERQTDADNKYRLFCDRFKCENAVKLISS
jgi:hypothetical protein